MITGRPTFVKMSIDVPKYKKTLQEAVEIQVRQAARVWLRTLLQAGLIPVWTGTSRGVFIPLGSYLHVDTTVTPLVHRAGQGPAYGAADANFSFKTVGTTTTFTFDHAVDRLTFNDQFNANDVGFRLTHPGPYHAFAKATDAWNEYVNNILPTRLPSPSEFENRTSLTYG